MWQSASQEKKFKQAKNIKKFSEPLYSVLLEQAKHFLMKTAGHLFRNLVSQSWSCDSGVKSRREQDAYIAGPFVSGVRRTTLKWILEGLAAWLLEPRLSAVSFLTGCRRLMDLAWKAEEQKFITAINMEKGECRDLYFFSSQVSLTQNERVKCNMRTSLDEGLAFKCCPPRWILFGHARYWWNRAECHQRNNSRWCSAIFYAIKCQGSIETGWIHTLTPVGHRISPECTRTWGSVVSFQQERENSDHCQVRHRYRNALHLRQTKYVWDSMEAVVNKKCPKDKQALEVFQYKSFLRFGVPPIFSINGRCGPPGCHIQQTCQRPLLQKDRELSLQHVFAWECEPYWFSTSYGGGKKKEEACCLCLSGLD